jgi:fatty acid desaturase
MSCPYSNLFGKPGEGVHAYRIFDIAIVDVVLTILGAWLLSYVLPYSFPVVLVGLFLTGIVLHHAFCVRTTIDKALFG